MFNHRPLFFPSDQSKVYYVIEILRIALAWMVNGLAFTQAVNANQSVFTLSYDDVVFVSILEMLLNLLLLGILECG